MNTKKNKPVQIKQGADAKILSFLSYFVTGSIGLMCLIPFIMVIAASFSSETAIARNGFSLWPQEFTFAAYETVFKDPMIIIGAYGVTVGITVIGTLLGLLLQTMTAYVLSRKDFEWRNKFSFFFYFTTLFNGGLVPSYIMITKFLHLKNTYAVLLFPLLFNVFNLLIMKSYIMAIPDSLVEAAKIDGAGEFKILFQVIMPMIKPALATVGLFIALAYWNDWYNAMLYVSNESMQPLQYFLYKQVNNIEAYKRILESGAGGGALAAMSMPTQTLKMALTVVVIGPIILLYPFVQKYFVQGITIGAVKG